MALRVICPNSCRLQVPDSRAGTIVRCPKCKQPIKIEDISTAKPAKEVDDLRTVEAAVPSPEELAKLKREVKQPKKRKKKKPARELVSASSSATSFSTQDHADKEQRGDPPQDERDSSLPEKSNPDLDDLPKTTEHHFESGEDELAHSSKSQDGRWLIEPAKEKKSTKADSNSRQDSKAKSRLAAKSKRSSKKKKKDREKSEKVTGKSDPNLTGSAAKSEIPDENDQHPESEPELKERTVGVTHSKDAKSRSTFLAFSLFLIGIFAIIPAVSEFVQYANMDGTTEIHRWAAWLVFIGALNIFYSVYVAQLSDWTSIWLVSLLMIGLSVVTATLLAGLALSNPQTSLIATLFEIAPSLKLRAEIWLLTMLSITSLVAYLSGREALRWKKIEKNLQAISTQSN